MAGGAKNQGVRITPKKQKRKNCIKTRIAMIRSFDKLHHLIKITITNRHVVCFQWRI
mgnify:FL=1